MCVCDKKIHCLDKIDAYSSDAFLYWSDVHLCIRSLRVYRNDSFSTLNLTLSLTYMASCYVSYKCITMPLAIMLFGLPTGISKFEQDAQWGYWMQGKKNLHFQLQSLCISETV